METNLTKSLLPVILYASLPCGTGAFLQAGVEIVNMMPPTGGAGVQNLQESGSPKL